MVLDDKRMIKEICFGKAIRVRYAPSPTGLLHIEMRGLLFNYSMLVIMQDLHYPYRDTDRKRHVEDGNVHNENLRWLGMIGMKAQKHMKTTVSLSVWNSTKNTLTNC